MYNKFTANPAAAQAADDQSLGALASERDVACEPAVPAEALLARFRALFDGRRRGFGVSCGPALPRTERGPVTPELYRRHLESDGSNDGWSLGLVPLRDDASVLFGALDFDAKALPEVEARALAQRASDLGFPLVWTRSLSDGVHAWLFLAEPASSADVRRLLHHWGLQLGWELKRGAMTKNRGDRFFEVFPKQESVAPDAVGNWIRLPWPGGERAQGRRGLWAREGSPTFAQWIAHAEDSRVSTARLRELLEAAQAGQREMSTAAPRTRGGTEAIGDTTAQLPMGSAREDGVTVAAARALLDRLPEEYCEDYEPWVKVLAGLHHQFAGTGDEADALALAIEWSRKSIKYENGVVEKKWDSFRNDGMRPEVTIRSLRFWATSSAVDVAVAELNERYAHVLKGGNAILVTTPNGEPDFLETRRWKEHLGNRLIEVDGKLRPLPELWLKHPDRRSFFSVDFDPTRPPHAAVPSRHGPSGDVDFNMWPGLALTPSREGSCDLFLTHLRDVVCDEDDELVSWVTQYLAHIVQRPHETAGTALVLRGPQGSGKSLVGEVMGEILGTRLYTKLSRPEELTGRFNGHHYGRLLMQVEEGFWAGDKKAEGPLKHLVTSPTVRIEKKFMDPIDLPNYARILITSNNSWVVPAGLGERRFAVLDVSGELSNDMQYFAALRRQMFHEGGCRRLLDYLLNDVVVDWDLLRRPPRTQALLEQQLDSLDAEDRWFLDILMEGVLPGDTRGEGRASTEEVINSYQRAMRDAGRRWDATKEKCGRYLSKRMAGAFTRERPNRGGDRARYYAFSPLNTCRTRFAETLSFELTWPEPGDWQPSDSLGVV